LKKLRIAMVVLALSIGVAVAVQYPEIRRYLRMTRM
jgi:hypothetical protein